MIELWIQKLKQSCKNRGLEITRAGPNTVIIDGIQFDRQSDCEKYLETIERID